MNLTIACLLLEQVNSEGFSGHDVKQNYPRFLILKLTRVSIYRKYARLHVLMEYSLFFVECVSQENRF